MEKSKIQRQLPASIATVPCPLLVHGDGYVEWGNEVFSSEFGIRPTAMRHLKTRELLWCLGVQDPLAGMIAEGVTFDHWEVPPLSQVLSALHLRQVRLEATNGTQLFMLIISDCPENLGLWHEEPKQL
jgi:hypothetical protein